MTGKFFFVRSFSHDVMLQFDAARMSYVIMLDSLAGTCAFKEFEGSVPFLRKPKRSDFVFFAWDSMTTQLFRLSVHFI